MALKVRDKKNLYAGIMFAAIAALFIIGARNYSMGTAVRMGPAYFPTWLGWILAGLSVLILIEAFVADGPDPRPTQWRPLLWILGAVIAFALLVGPLSNFGGLVVACLAVLIMSAYGGDEFKWKEQLPLAIGLTIATVLIFVNGLGLPFKLFPWS
jgi:Mn2+/Fe2+ NRAMP family transporter